MVSAKQTLGWTLVLGVAALGCDAIVSVAATASDFGGATADAHCDRRFVTDGGQAAAFCQEVVNTVAASQFSDDCREALRATPGTGTCPRASIIGGCKLLKKNGDDSLVWDWYYDVSGMVAEAGPYAGPDGGPTFDIAPRTLQDVGALCASTSRYPDGADLVPPP